MQNKDIELSTNKSNSLLVLKKMSLVKLLFWLCIGFGPYWEYAQWSSYAKKTTKSLSPFWRVWFSIFWIPALFSKLGNRKSIFIGILAAISQGISFLAVKASTKISSQMFLLIWITSSIILAACCLYFQHKVNQEHSVYPEKDKPLYFADRSIKFGKGFYVIIFVSILAMISTISGILGVSIKQ